LKYLSIESFGLVVNYSTAKYEIFYWLFGQNRHNAAGRPRLSIKGSNMLSLPAVYLLVVCICISILK
jgi:hypothetical protein